MNTIFLFKIAPDKASNNSIFIVFIPIGYHYYDLIFNLIYHLVYVYLKSKAPCYINSLNTNLILETHRNYSAKM